MIAGLVLELTIFGSTPAYAGVMRVPYGGRLLSGADVRIVIQPLPDFAGSVNGPVKTAPACKVI